MPLRDHFRPPGDNITPWEGFHGQWPAMLVLWLARKLPLRYKAEPCVHLGPFIEFDIATFEKDESKPALPNVANGNGGSVATAVWAPARPTLSITTDFPAQDEYEVRVYDTKRGRRLVIVFITLIALIGEGGGD